MEVLPTVFLVMVTALAPRLGGKDNWMNGADFWRSSGLSWVIQQLEKLGADEGNPFAKRIRETCRSLMARLRKLDVGRSHPPPGHTTSSRDNK